jgi:hypothetical protein
MVAVTGVVSFLVGVFLGEGDGKSTGTFTGPISRLNAPHNQATHLSTAKCVKRRDDVCLG